MTIDDFNPDAMDIDALTAFAATYITYENARIFFKSVPPKGYVRTFKHCVSYAHNKSIAMQLRIDGQIDLAMQREAICERIYQSLPAYARW